MQRALIARQHATDTARSHPLADAISALGYKLRNQYERNSIIRPSILKHNSYCALTRSPIVLKIGRRVQYETP